MMAYVATVGDVLWALFGFGLIALFLWWLGSQLTKLVAWWREQRGGSRKATGDAGAAPPIPGGRDLTDNARAVLQSVRDRVAARFAESFFENRRSLQQDKVFAASVDQVRALALPTEMLVSLAAGYDHWITRVVLPVLSERDDIPDRWLLMAIRRLPPAPWDLAGLYVLSLEKAPGEVIGNVLAKTEDVRGDDVVALIAARVELGREVVDAELMRRHVPITAAEQIQTLLETYELPESVRNTFAEWLESALDFGEAGRYVKLRTRPFGDGPVLVEGRRAEVADELVAALQESPPRSAILVGEHGVGKSALVGEALERLPDGWIVFEAGATQINADAMYVGQLEGRIEDLVQRLHGRSAVWLFPAFEEALYAGTYSNHPTGMLDALLPHIEAGTIRIVAEITPANWELLVAKRPRVQSALRALRLVPLSDAETVRILSHALANDGHDISTDEAVLQETFELAQQFLPGVAQPGGAMRLLEATVDAALESEATAFDTGDVLASLAVLSGLPLALLDPKRPLDLDEVRGFFNERVLGQEHAVGAIVDRIALVKAGLTDPTRPLGVFLFVGPTGTGKTELAKTLAQFMFGSASRLVRLDMSEFQTPESLERLLTDSSLDETGAALIASVRRDPFSVVLLDEFEKASPPVWDLFLQVFDDGRLTDRAGRTTDFRRCIIVLTSNVGSALQYGPTLGFSTDEPGFHASDVERALRRAFRPEFLNRIDKILTFQPFGREQMRALLDKELEEVVRRRGIRGKPWAMELDESAISFLLDAGFSPTLGARPLKRAVEEHLLTPLARTIVDADAPEGDQFLFVTAPHGAIEVHFVGLDEEQTGVSAQDAPPEAEDPVADAADVRSLLRNGRADPDAQRILLSQLSEIETRVVNEVVERKHRALDLVSSPAFWEDDGRYHVLAEVEYLDRLEAACRTASKLGGRLRRRLEGTSAEAGADANGSRDAELFNLLGFRIYSLGRALEGLDVGAPFELFLRLRVVGDQAHPPETELLFLEQLVEMYLGWAKGRGMQVEVIDRLGDQVLLHAGGLGAGLILQPEAGLHILELPGGDGRHERSLERVTVAVQVAECEPGERITESALREQARQAFGKAEARAQVVRRYREGPSALVRDAARGYRTGRLDTVLAGGFDLFAGES
ncbi:MAG: ATP-dependent Clp protease ATP-binding subunit [Actinobacteria bacterium]|nr:ATP-dependent Clp protease ATP-binding subunit [Actinomycetota bacterium]